MDPIIFLPNGLGLVLGVVMMVLCILYPKNDALNDETNSEENLLQDNEEFSEHAENLMVTWKTKMMSSNKFFLNELLISNTFVHTNLLSTFLYVLHLNKSSSGPVVLSQDQPSKIYTFHWGINW